MGRLAKWWGHRGVAYQAQEVPFHSVGDGALLWQQCIHQMISEGTGSG